MKKITVLDYGLGNLLSVKRAVEFNSYDCKVSNLKEDIEDSSHLIIPGVGAFSNAINTLKNSFLSEYIVNHANKGLPILGICLGMQLLADIGYEGSKNYGLGLISGEVKRLPSVDPISNKQLKVPNIGWRSVKSSLEKKNNLFDERTNNKEYYHVHSYQFIPLIDENIIGKSKFGNIDIVVAIREGNIFGTQFHPEKSGEAGLLLLKKFLSI
tara:strand:+ start:752 stop:1387 length:636 start_codon:yes stop_codon:yes gene_type:complete